MHKRFLVTALVCVLMVLAAYFTWQLVFFEYETDSTTRPPPKRLFTVDHLAKLVPLLIISLLTAVGIVACVVVRSHLMRRDALRTV